MSFVNDIQMMMHGFGDCRSPLLETAALIENVVHQQMTALLQQAIEVNESRNMGPNIGPEDIIFVIRKDHLKLQRLVNYMGVRDLYQKTTAASSGRASKDLIESNEENSRKSICTNFLQSLDETGEYEAVCTGSLADPIQSERKIRADIQAQGMSGAQYKEYSLARRASFCPRLRVNKFRDWLLIGPYSEVKLSQLVGEMLNFLAYETVAQIVDLALLVKRDVDSNKNDLSRFQIRPALNPDYPSVLIQQGSMFQNNQVDPNKESLLGMHAITPDEVREAIRRYWDNKSPFKPFSKTRSPIGSVLLAG